MGKTIYGYCENKGKHPTYSKEKIDSMIAEKAELSHNHDDRYYTETEVNNLLASYTPEEINKRLANLGLGGQCKLITGDLNTACGTATGFYRGLNLTNRPSTTAPEQWLYIIHLVHNEGYQKQIAFNYFANMSWERTKVEGVWSEWTTIVKSGSFAVITGSVTLAANSNINLYPFEQTIWTVNYPSGFTKDNCVCIAFGGNRTTSKGYSYGYITNKEDSGVAVAAGVIPRTATLNSDAISCMAFNPSSNAVSLNYKIVLMKE